MKPRVVLLVVATWVLLALIWGSQMTLGATLQGNALSFRDATYSAFLNALPWIPSTLLIIAVTRRFPVSRGSWTRNLWPHLLAYPTAAFLTNMFVVLGFWISAGQFQGVGILLWNAGFWMSVRLHIAALIYLAVAGLTQAIQHYRAGQARELRIARLEASLAKARMDALNAQLRPHFLFNTLHTIGHLWRSGRSDEADRLLDHLGSLFERVQTTTATTQVPLADELEMVEDYLAIESARFSDRLQVSIDTPPETLDCMVPPLVLQPLVENAIRHGISQSSAAGRISVTAALDHGDLRIRVEDDGPGLRDDAPSRGTGTGLSNLRARLDEMFGSDGGLTISSLPDSGCAVELTLPARSETAGFTVGDGRSRG